MKYVFSFLGSASLWITVGICFWVEPSVVFAETYTALSNIPGIDKAAESAASGDFTKMINLIYKMAIGFGAALAVLFLILGGVQYSMSSVSGVRSELKQRMTSVLGGMGLLLGAYLLLDIINPNLNRLDTPTITPVDNQQGLVPQTDLNFGTSTEPTPNDDTTRSSGPTI